MQVFGIFSRFFLLLLHINPNDIFTVSIYCAANEIEWHVPKSDANKKIKYNTCETSMTKINEIEDNNNRSHHCDYNMNKSRGRYAKKKIHFDLIYWREDILSRSRKIHRKRNNNDSTNNSFLKSKTLFVATDDFPISCSDANTKPRKSKKWVYSIFLLISSLSVWEKYFVFPNFKRKEKSEKSIRIY